jgi:hypothetical protein
MPTGRCHCVRSPARKSIEQRGRRKEEEKTMRNEGRAAAGRQNLSNKYDHHSSLTISRTCEALAPFEFHGLHALGEHDPVDSTFEREGKKEARRKWGMRKRGGWPQNLLNNIIQGR